jgi:predicted MFS family arabinose efflux permease
MISIGTVIEIVLVSFGVGGVAGATLTGYLVKRFSKK